MSARLVQDCQLTGTATSVRSSTLLLVEPVVIHLRTGHFDQMQFVTHEIGGEVARRVERWTCDEQVVGSNPTRDKAA